MVIQRLDLQGDVLWSKVLSGTGQAIAADIQRAQLNDGFWIVFNSPSGALGQTQGGWMKISENGDLVLFSRQATSATVFKKIMPLSDGGYLISGYDDPSGFTNAFAMKINASGDMVWKTGFGDVGDDAIENCWEDDEGFIYCAGFSGDLSLGQDGLLAKVSPSGTVLWARRYGTAGAGRFVSVRPYSGDTTLLLAGYSSGFGNNNQVWLAKVTLAGNLKWSRSYSLPGQALGAVDLLQVPGSQFLVSAADPNYQFGSPAILFKISEDGNLLWEYEYKSGGEHDIFRELLATAGGFAAVGSSTVGGDENFYVLKIAGDGLIPGSSCCPAPAGLTVKDVFPEVESFTHGVLDAFNSSDYLALSADIEFQVTDICTPIDLACSISDSSICPGECIDITVTGNTPGVAYSFSTPGGVPDPANPLRICYPEAGVYFITRKGENDFCSKELSVRLEVGSLPDVFPNAFTPNGDGVNDTFKPVFFCPVVASYFRVYNRWGQKVFETRDPLEAWDGKIDGEEASSDVYAWQVEYEVVREGQQQKLTEKGDVALLR